MPRRSQDLLLTVSRALPAQNTSAATSAIDLGSVLPDTALESIELVISVPATTCATGQTITLTPQDSADNSAWAALSRVAPLVLTGASNATAATGELRYRLPSNTRRYFRVNITMSATTGDQTAITAIIRLDS
jgi:hypothetical protein